MEVRHQSIDRAEAVARRDEDVGRPREGADRAVRPGRALQEPQGCGAHRDDPVAPRPHGVEPLGGGGVEETDLGMHPVGIGVVRLDGQEGAGPDMQRDVKPLDPRPVDPLEQRVGKVQPGRGSGDRAGLAGVDGLIVSGVPRIGGALAGDVGGERQGAEPGDGLVERRPGEVEAQKDLTALPSLLHRGVERGQGADFAGCLPGIPVAEADAVAGGEALGRAGEGAPAVGCLAQVQHRLATLPRSSRPVADAGEAGRDHPRVVEDERVAGIQEGGQVAHAAIRQGGAGAHHEKAARVARARRPQRDRSLRQLEIEKVYAHPAPSARMGARRKWRMMPRVQPRCRPARWTSAPKESNGERHPR